MHRNETFAQNRKSKVNEEISADITANSKQYHRPLFIVYDLGYVQNAEEFKRDIENAGNVKVIIVKYQYFYTFSIEEYSKENTYKYWC